LPLLRVIVAEASVPFGKQRTVIAVSALMIGPSQTMLGRTSRCTRVAYSCDAAVACPVAGICNPPNALSLAAPSMSDATIDQSR
jgi:hypothetical protein